MKYRQEKVGEVLVVRVDETRLDSTVSPQFKAELLRLVEDKKEKKILIDLKKVDYVDSSGLGALLFGHRQLKSNSGKLKLVHLSTKIRTLIKIAKLDDVLEGFTSEKEALKSF
ncbi:MAG TPA: STAS domain-containing protein [bacterium]